jgi:hypothetical protein
MVKIEYIGNEPEVTKRYLIFAMVGYEAQGGLRDVVAEADTLEELVVELAEVKKNYSSQYDEIRLYDQETRLYFEVVDE